MSVKASGIWFPAIICTFLLGSCNNTDSPKNTNSGSNTGYSLPAIQSFMAEDPGVLESDLVDDSLNTEVRLKLAAIYYANQAYDDAIRHNLTVLRIDKNNMAALFNLGNIYYDIEQDNNAIKYYEKFLELEKNNTNVRCDLATCYMRENNLDKAIEVLRENIKIDFNHQQSHYNLSVILRQKGKTDEADAEMQIYNELLAGQQGKAR